MLPGQHSTGPLDYHSLHSVIPNVNFRKFKKNLETFQNENIKVVIYHTCNIASSVTFCLKRKKDSSADFISKITFTIVSVKLEFIYLIYHEIGLKLKANIS